MTSFISDAGTQPRLCENLEDLKRMVFLQLRFLTSRGVNVISGGSSCLSKSLYVSWLISRTLISDDFL